MTTEKSITDKIPKLSGKGVKFRFIGGKNAGKEIAVTAETFFIGRSANNNLVLEDRSVSRKQAVLNLLEGKFILSDLNSFKGTRVNGEKIHEVQLKNGDRIKMGSITLEFIEGVEPPKAKRRKWVFWPIFLVSLIAVTAMIILSLEKKETPMSHDLLRDIEYNYLEGIKSYNVDKNLESARLYWNKVIELDPKGETAQGRKAMNLLNNLPDDR